MLKEERKNRLFQGEMLAWIKFCDSFFEILSYICTHLSVREN